MSRRITTADGIDPAVKALIAAMHVKGLTSRGLRDASGVSPHTLMDWSKGRRAPSAVLLRTALNAVGLDLLVVPKRWPLNKTRHGRRACAGCCGLATA